MSQNTAKFVLISVSAFAVFYLIFRLIQKRKIEKETKMLKIDLNGVYDDKNSLAAINHNPTNIIKSKYKWEGATATPQRLIDEGRTQRFEAFENDYYGLRAALINLKNGYFAKGYNTISKIINKWAPPTENNTNAYINYVSAIVGIDKDKVLNYDDKNIMFLLLKAIAKRDGGFNGEDLIKYVIYKNH